MLHACHLRLPLAFIGLLLLTVSIPLDVAGQGTDRISFRDTSWQMSKQEVQAAVGCDLTPSKKKKPGPGGDDQFGRDWKEASFFRCEEELVGSLVAVVYRFDQGKLTAVKVRFLPEGKKRPTDDFDPQQKEVLKILTEKYGPPSVTSEYGATTHDWGRMGVRLYHQPWHTWAHGAHAQLDIIYEPPRTYTPEEIDEAEKEKL